ncbi:MAG TPA: DUF3604 domain-containing protein [Candidatus Binatia bacterium]|nr:DUF3604 domain-containing protein [Candidatus Binatia bacterium]
MSATRAGWAPVLAMGACALLAACSDGGRSSAVTVPGNADVGCTGAHAEVKHAYYGDLHVHTRDSVDAYNFQTMNGPREAYQFARGQPLGLPGGDSDPHIPLRLLQLDRPLDFASVIDHSDFLGGWYEVCQGSGAVPAGTNPGCEVVGDYVRQNIRQFVEGDAPVPLLAITTITGQTPQTQMPWAGQVAIADEQNVPCSFSTFPGYEFTSQRHGQHIHRQVIFGPGTRPPDVIHVQQPPDLVLGSNADEDWDLLEELAQQCPPGGECNALTIPHNPNLSDGGLFLPADPVTGVPPARGGVPMSKADAELRAQYDRVIEIFQHKGNSECGIGLDGGWLVGDDADCNFELTKNICWRAHDDPANPAACRAACSGDPAKDPAWCRLQYHPTFATDVCQVEGRDGTSGPTENCIAPLDMARNVLAQGLAIRRKLGVNPQHLGFIGSTDTHGGDAGNVREQGFTGHGGVLDDEPKDQLGFWACDNTSKTEDPSNPANCTNRVFLDWARGFNPGGLAGAWAPENTRGAIFGALQRGETFATSGPRLRIRTVAMWQTPPANACDVVLSGRTPAGAIAMGSNLPLRAGAGAPWIVAAAERDVGGDPGLPLERLDLVKAWLDAGGQPKVKVYAGVASTGAASVEPSHADCGVVRTGHPAKLCAVWRDPDFDAAHDAFWYARVQEIPSCRWSTQLCTTNHVDCTKLDAANGMFPDDSGLHGFEGCCLIAGAPGSFTGRNSFNVVREKGWSSPVWYEAPAGP